MNRSAFCFLAASLISPSTLALDQSVVGSYAVVHVDGHVTDKVFRVLQPEDGWKVERKNPDGSWEDVTCEAECVMRQSSATDIERFLGKPPEGVQASCTHNSAFALCRVTDSKKTTAPQYVFVALTEREPIHLRLTRQPSEE